MSSAPLVSIITPARNAARTIVETIDSVTAQSWQAWEMLVIDDASSDETRAIVAHQANQEPRIHLLPLARQGGAAQARNAGLAAARGRFVAFLDADDLWMPGKLTRQLDFMQSGGYALSCTAFRRIPSEGGQPGRLIQVPDRLTYEGLLKNTAIASVTAMVDRDQTGAISFPEVNHEDYALWLSLLKRGLAAGGLNEDLARYRFARDSLSGNKLRSALWVWQVYREVEQLGLLKSSWCLANYGLNALRKRVGVSR